MHLIGRMALVAVVIGASVSAASTERVDLSLVLTGSIAWSFVPLAQLLTGLLLIRGAAGPRTHALERYFSTHTPWSLWIIATHAAFLVVPPLRMHALWVAATGVIPGVWTARLLTAFGRDALGLGAAEARRRVVAHQAVTLLMILAYVQFAVALWPRILGAMA